CLGRRAFLGCPNGTRTVDDSSNDERWRNPARGGERRARAALAAEVDGQNDGSADGAARADTIAGIVARLRASSELAGRFVAWHETPPRPPRVAEFPAGLAPELVALLRARGLGELFEHQARAIELALAGRAVLIATP